MSATAKGFVQQFIRWIFFFNTVLAHPEFQAKIPNGDKVIDGNGNPWGGVGHFRPEGAGPLNPFGKDFQSAGYEWTEQLCKKDSDEDGFTNGEELGDPDCEWKIGRKPQFDAYITHPGLKGDRNGATYNSCESYTLPEDVEEKEIKFTTAHVIAPKETAYVKQAIIAPSINGEQVFVTKISPIIDQSKFVHHMLLYACDQIQAESFLSPIPPRDDGGMPCTELVFAWAVGGKTFCLPKNVFLPIVGDYLMLEIHYDNPNLEMGQLDNSGMALSVVAESKLPPNYIEAGYLWNGIALNEIKIPPGNEQFHMQGECKIPTGNPHIPKDGVEIFATISHAHKIGIKLYTTIESIGEEDQQLMACEPRYDFDLQEFKSLQNKIKLSRGDTIRVNCIYDSSKRNQITRGGDGSEDEMCISIAMYVPRLEKGLTSKCWASGDDVRIIQESDSEVCTADSQIGDFILDANQVYAVPGWIKQHGIIMGLAWGILIPIGILIPLLNRKDLLPSSMSKQWFNIHRFFIGIGFILTIVGIIINITNKSIHFTTVHGKLGISVGVLTTVQVCGGIFRPHIESNGENSNTRKKWELFHHITGRSVVLLAMSGLVTGIFGSLMNYVSLDEVIGVVILIFVSAAVTLVIYCLVWIFVSSDRSKGYATDAVVVEAIPVAQDVSHGFVDEGDVDRTSTGSIRRRSLTKEEVFGTVDL